MPDPERTRGLSDKRAQVVLHMVMTFVIAIVLAQLWLFTVALDAMANPQASMQVGLAAGICSLIGCAAVWMLIVMLAQTETRRYRD